MERTTISGWIAVGISTMISSLWAFWGAFESFHEGWYFKSLGQNLICTARYLTLMFIFTALSVIALRWPRAGGILYELFGVGFCVWILMTRKVLNVGVILSFVPVLVPPLFLGILFWVGRPNPLSLAYKICILVPLGVAAAFAAEPVIRIAGRIDDGHRGPRLVTGNNVELIWAPSGPGWPDPDPRDKTWLREWRGPTWEEAQGICRHLTADGKSVADTEQNIWRLPAVDEVVRSMTRHGKNCGGVWDAAKRRASYTKKPDKESPLWNPHSVIIYWWTSSELGTRRAYSVDFNGNVYIRDKKSHLGSQAFRAVRDVNKN